MDAHSTGRRGQPFLNMAAAIGAAILGSLLGLAVAEEPPNATPAIQPGDISIGEPIALPFGGPRATPPAPPAAPAAIPGTLVPGSGWVGLAVEESEIPGRWRIVEVAPGGPADRAGIAVGDELRAVNGVTLASPEDVSQALTVIAAGQEVPMAVGRADQVRDIVLRADVRPQVRPTEPQRVSEQPTAAPAPASMAAATPAPAPAPAAASTAPAAAPLAAPPPAAPAASPVAGLPPANAEWQSAPIREPSPPQASRFPQPSSLPDPTFAPAPLSAAAAAPTPMPAPVAAPLAAPSSLAPPSNLVPAPGRTALGVRTVPIDPATQARFHLPEQAGAYVVGVVQDLPAAKAGVPPGSVIVALGEQPVRSPLELTKLVTNGPLDRPVTVQFVMPGGESKQAAVRLETLDAPLERALAGPDDSATTPAPLLPAPLPRRAERPIADDGPIRAEIRALRSRLERLERALLPAPGGGR